MVSLCHNCLDKKAAPQSTRPTLLCKKQDLPFGFGETSVVLEYLTRWVRLRFRAVLWRRWKTPRRRGAALIALGVRPRLASNTAASDRGPWYLARSKALSVGLSNAYFRSLGLPSLVERG